MRSSAPPSRHLIGRPLIALNFQQQRYEADFRFNLVRVRENSEQIALLDGERAETERLLLRFGNVVANWYAIMTRQKRLTFFTASYSQISTVFPFIIVSPAYFAGAVQLGGLMQTANAFGQVQSALSFFVNIYRNLAEWRAVVERLDGFDQSVAAARAVAVARPAIELKHGEAGGGEFQGSGGAAAERHAAGHRQRHFDQAGRARAGQRPVGIRQVDAVPRARRRLAVRRGSIWCRKAREVMILPQRPYFPIAPLAGRGRLPGRAGPFRSGRGGSLDRRGWLAGFGQTRGRGSALEPDAALGEQQRLGVARAILHAPDYLFLDEATASLDEPGRGRALSPAEERLAHTTIVSIGHRSTLAAFHDRRLEFTREGEAYALREGGLARLKEKGAATVSSRRPIQGQVIRVLLQAAERQRSRQLGGEGRAAPPRGVCANGSGSFQVGVCPTLAPGSLVKAEHSVLLRSVSL